MDFATDALLLPYIATNHPQPQPQPQEQSSPKRARPDSWRMWLAARVGAAEAALASVFVGGAALAASPARRRKEALPEPEPDPADESDSGNDADFSFREAWGAVRRAAAAAMATLEVEENVGGFLTDSEGGGAEIRDVPKLWDEHGANESEEEEGELVDAVGCRSDEDVVEKALLCEDYRSNDLIDIEYSEITASSSLGDGVSRRQSMVPSVTDCVHDESVPDSETSTTAKDVDCWHVFEQPEVSTDTPQSESPRDTPATRALREQFRARFERNGGTHCLTQIKQIADDLLLHMRDTSSLAASALPEVQSTKAILDDALHQLDFATRRKLNDAHPDYAEVAQAAQAVIEQSNELERDACRLLAVFAAKICSAILKCVQAKCEWRERVSRVAEVAGVGVGQLRVVAEKFGVHGLTGEAVGVVIRGGALAIAALQVEAVEQAYA